MTMGTINENDWIQKCPKCGNDNRNQQSPVTFELAVCPHCGAQVFPRKDGVDLVLYYRCEACGCRYLTPKLEQSDQEWRLFNP